MRYFFWSGCAIIVTSIVIHIRRHNSFIQSLQEATLTDPRTEDDFNKRIEDDFIYSL